MTDALSRLTAALSDRYRLEGELGAGGMATVYLAEDVKHRRRVAVKVLRSELAAVLGAERFLREIETTANLRHPHILPLYDSGEAGGFLYYVMPLIEGESLRDRLCREPPLPIDEALQITREVADALGYAHARGVIHRDIKPENILLESGHAVVADFGIAKAVSALDGGSLTQTGLAVGTPAYMSPEQVLADAALDGRSDLYSLGCVLFEMLVGEPPFAATTSQRTIARRLTEAPPVVNAARPEVGSYLSGVIERVLATDPANRPATAADFAKSLSTTAATHSTPASDSGAVRKEEGFWVAVLPFKYSGTDADLTALAEGLSEEIITGLSRFSYLRVMSRTATAGYAKSAVDGHAAGQQLGARYVMEGSIRQAGSRLRIAVQLVDASTGGHLWAETYDRLFRQDKIFELQDDLVPQIVSTVADMHGVLPHTMSEALRSRTPDQLSPYEAVLRSFGYFDRVTAEENAAALAGLESAVQKTPGYADGWAMLAFLIVQDYGQGFNVQPDPLGRGLAAAHRAVEAAPSNYLAQYALAQALFFRKEFQAFRIAAERTLALNPMDGNATSHLGMLTACAGDWERGCALAERATQLNPHHPGWYWFPLFFDAYRKGNYRGALDAALKVNLPGHIYTSAVTAAAYAQLGEREQARTALRQLLTLKPEFAATAREEFGRWFDAELTSHLIDGLRKAGLDISGPEGAVGPEVAVVVLPFINRSPDPGNEYFSDGLTEEIITDLSRIAALRVISRNSSMALKGTTNDTHSIVKQLGVTHLVSGSVRRVGDDLRVTAELIEGVSDSPLWSEKYSGTMADVFGIQEEIAQKIVLALKVTLTEREARQVAERPIENPVAYDCYLRARQEMYAWTPEASRRALRLVDDALAIVGDTPLLLATKAQLYWNEVNTGQVPAGAGLDRAADFVGRALALAPDFPLAIFVRGLVAGSRGQPERALPDLYRAHELWPGDANIVAEFCRFSNSAGLRNKGEFVDRLVQVDPLTPVTPLVVCAHHILRGQYLEAAIAARRAIEMAPVPSMLHVLAAWTIAEAGFAEEACQTLGWVGTLMGDTVLGSWALFLKHAREGNVHQALSCVTPEVEQAMMGNEFTSRTVVHGYALLGRADDAFRWLRTAIDRGFINYPSLERDQFLGSLRDDPRFRQLMDEVRPRWEAVVAWERSR